MSRLRASLLGLVILMAAMVLPASASALTVVNFAYTGGVQTWTVPFGVTSASFNLYGAQGRGFGPGSSAQGGEGGWANKTISVTPNTQISIRVGGQGAANAGGFNGGGTGVYGGGGATDIRIGGEALTDRVLVAGGGGGGGFSCLAGGVTTIAVGGYGGGLTGGSGNNTGCSPSGTGGTQSGGGTPGGTLGQGGPGGPSGGGGGYYGGGGAIAGYSNGGPGGGGSSFGPPGLATDSGVQEGNGRASVDFNVTNTQRLQASATGAGSGWISTSPAGVDCGTNDIQASHNVCFYDYGQDQPVTITANPSPGSVFTSWAIGTGGPCQGSTSPTCTTTMSATKTVSANFANGPRTVSVTKAGTGSGTVTSSPAGINCGATCSSDFAYGTSVTLTPNPATGSDFTGWTGACAGTDPCTVTADQARSVTATFTLKKFTLTLGKFENGSGTVTSSPAGINYPTGATPCGLNGDCVSAQFDYGTVVTLTPTAATGSTFIDWGGVCQPVPASQNCTITMDQDRYSEVEFVLQKHALNVTRDGNGSGAVTSSPAGINCGATCSNSYDHGTQVTLTAAPDGNSQFTGWSGACTNTSGTCTVTMDQVKHVEAEFPLQKRGLAVSRSGNGLGAITSNPGGIDCGSACVSSFDIGSTVTLQSTPATGSDFTGWTGACAGTGACSVTMDQAKTVGAAFTLEKRALTVARSGTGGGAVTSTPAGIDCGRACSFTYDYDTVIRLTASPDANSDFTGWTGACTGSNDACLVKLDEVRNVEATFVPVKHSLSITDAGTGQGMVTSNPSGIECGASCAAAFDHGTSITLTPAPAAGSRFTGWSGACSGASTCTVSMDQEHSVIAEFSDIPPVITSLSVAPGRVVARGGKPRVRRAVKIRLNLTENSTVHFVLSRKAARNKAQEAYSTGARSGASTVLLPAKIRKKLRPGRYTLTAIATDPLGVSSPAKVANFRVVRRR